MLHYDGEHDTIAAIATAPGRSGISIVKVSGPGALPLLMEVLSSSKNPESHERTMIYGTIVDNDAVIDSVLACYMKGPNSYTGEDVVEIQSHGGSASATTVLSMLTDRGARIADPGEFTKRAFLNGKMDLVQAEAVMEIVAAEGREYLLQAEKLVNGTFSQAIENILENIKTSIAYIELNIDFHDHDPHAIDNSNVLDSIKTTIHSLDTMITSYTTAKRLKDGVTVVLAGPVNTGKSTLFNTLLGRKRSIVNETPGTTRDWIEEKIEIDGLPINIIDTAGLRVTDCMIEHEGMTETQRLVQHSDIILNLIDAPSYTDSSFTDQSYDDRFIHVLTKTDLKEDLHPPSQCIPVSSLSNSGIEQLKNCIINTVKGHIQTSSSSTLVLLERHKNELLTARGSLQRAIDIFGTAPEEIIALELRDAEHHIESILGRNIGFDILDTIFSNFCIGK